MLTNCRETLQGREQTSILLAKHSPRGNFIAGLPHKLIMSSTIKWAPHDKRLTKHRLDRMKFLSLHSPKHASHCSHSCQESTRDKCFHIPTLGEPCTAWTNNERALNSMVQSHSIARCVLGFHPGTSSLPLWAGAWGSSALWTALQQCQKLPARPWPLHSHPLCPLQQCTSSSLTACPQQSCYDRAMPV